MELYQRILILLLAVAVAIPVVVRSRLSADTRAPAAFSVQSSAHGFVQVIGDVRHPGLYPLNAKTMTMDVIIMAVPLRPVFSIAPPAAGTALPVNGEALTLTIGSDGCAVVSRGSIVATQRLVLGIPLEINTISESDLDRVPGIGPVMARNIARYRQKNGGNMAVQELLQVEGISEKKYSVLRKYF